MTSISIFARQALCVVLGWLWWRGSAKGVALDDIDWHFHVAFPYNMSSYDIVTRKFHYTTCLNTACRHTTNLHRTCQPLASLGLAPNAWAFRVADVALADIHLSFTWTVSCIACVALMPLAVSDGSAWFQVWRWNASVAGMGLATINLRLPCP